MNTVRSRPEAQRTRSLQKCFSRIFTRFHWIRLFRDIIYYINSLFVLSVLVESSEYSWKTLLKGSSPFCLSTRPYGMYINYLVFNPNQAGLFQLFYGRGGVESTPPWDLGRWSRERRETLHNCSVRCNLQVCIVKFPEIIKYYFILINYANLCIKSYFLL